MLIVNPMIKKIDKRTGREDKKPRSHEKRNIIKDYRRQDERPVERTQDLCNDPPKDRDETKEKV
jgi:hypothetical protein